MKSVMIGAKKMRFDQYAGYIASNFRIHRDFHLRIPTVAETPSALTLARSNLIRLPSLDWPSWLLLPAALALSRHLLADHRLSCISWIGIGKTYAVQSLTFQRYQKTNEDRVSICFLHPWHLILLKLGFSTKLHLHCLHLKRVCGLCHHPSLSNSSPMWLQIGSERGRETMKKSFKDRGRKE